MASPLLTAGLPARPPLLIEWGEPFLGSGPLADPWVLPTGAVWRPAFWVFGTYRTAVQALDLGADDLAEWVHRLDLHLNLRLSGTERILLTLRPLDRGLGRFTRVAAGTRDGDRPEEELNLDIESLFFEGELAEIFPRLDPGDSRALDLRFSLGKQPVSFQQGMLLDDTITGLGVNAINFHTSVATNLRITGFLGWNDINRGTNLPGVHLEEGSTSLVGLFTQADTATATIDLDLVLVNGPDGSGDSLHGGLGFLGRTGRYNTTFRLLASRSLDPENLIHGRGVLTTAEVSFHTGSSHDLVYMNGFWAMERFVSAARDPLAGGPLGRIGILYAAPRIGSAGSPLDSQSERAVGTALGYQHFLDTFGTEQIIFEVGGRRSTDTAGSGQAALGVQYRRASGPRLVHLVEGSLTARERDHGRASLRYELTVKF